MISYRIQNYTDYRNFLEAVFQFEKTASKSKFSKQKFARKLGLSDTNFRMICTGRRNLTPDNAFKISQKLKLSKRDTEYFMNLVYLSNLKSSAAKQIVNGQLKRFELDSKTMQLNSSYREFILDSKLQAVIVFAKDTNLDLKNDESAVLISKKFNLSVIETKSIFRKIDDLGISFEEPQGFHIIYTKLSSGLSRDEYLRNEFMEAARLAKNSESTSCLFSAKTFSISKFKISEFAQEYKQLTEKYMIPPGDSEKKIEVVRVLFHLRPMTVK